MKEECRRESCWFSESYETSSVGWKLRMIFNLIHASATWWFETLFCWWRISCSIGLVTEATRVSYIGMKFMPPKHSVVSSDHYLTTPALRGLIEKIYWHKYDEAILADQNCNTSCVPVLGNLLKHQVLLQLSSKQVLKASPPMRLESLTAAMSGG